MSDELKKGRGPRLGMTRILRKVKAENKELRTALAEKERELEKYALIIVEREEALTLCVGIISSLVNECQVKRGEKHTARDFTCGNCDHRQVCRELKALKAAGPLVADKCKHGLEWDKLCPVCVREEEEDE